MRIIRAIYDKNLYQESLTQKFSKPFSTWLLISLISILTYIIYLGIMVYNNLPTIDEIKNEIPYFEINDGILSIEEKVEFTSDEEPFVIIIDDEYTYNPNDFRYAPQYLVATIDTLYFKSEGNNLEEIKYSDVEFLQNTNRDILISRLQEIIPNQMVVAFVFIVLFLFIIIIIFILVFKFFSILFYSLVGLIVSKILKKSITFSDSIKITLYGNVLPTILGTIYWLVFQRGVYWLLSFLFITIYIGYFISQLYNQVPDEEVPIPEINTANSSSEEQIGPAQPIEVTSV